MREDIVSRAVPATGRAGQLSARLRETRDYRATMPVASRRRRLSESSGRRAGGRRVRRRVSTVEVEAAGGAVAMLSAGVRVAGCGLALHAASVPSAAGGGSTCQLRVGVIPRRWQ